MRIHLKPPVSYYGGKQTLLSYILPLIPYDKTLYCEPFFGGGAVFFAKAPHKVEIINDLNQEVVNFFRVVQSNFAELQTEVECTAHSRQLHRDAYVVYENPHLFNPVKRAWAFWVLCNQGFASGIGKGWAYARKDNACEKKMDNARARFTEAYKQRLNRVQIECNRASTVIKSRDSEDSFFYCDPPYFNSDCGHYDGYRQVDFEEDLSTLAGIKGKFLLSSYPSDVLNSFVKANGWTQITVEKKIAVTYKTSKKKIEVFTANYNIDELAIWL